MHGRELLSRCVWLSELSGMGGTWPAQSLRWVRSVCRQRWAVSRFPQWLLGPRVARGPGGAELALCALRSPPGWGRADGGGRRCTCEAAHVMGRGCLLVLHGFGRSPDVTLDTQFALFVVIKTHARPDGFHGPELWLLLSKHLWTQ